MLNLVVRRENARLLKVSIQMAVCSWGCSILHIKNLTKSRSHFFPEHVLPYGYIEKKMA
jgi:hypothetical protein